DPQGPAPGRRADDRRLQARARQERGLGAGARAHRARAGDRRDRGGRLRQGGGGAALEGELHLAVQAAPVSPERRLGLGSASALVVAAMIGTGVFTTSGFLLADLGSPWAVLAVWAVGGLVAALGAVSYGALAGRVPESGG